MLLTNLLLNKYTCHVSYIEIVCVYLSVACLVNNVMAKALEV